MDLLHDLAQSLGNEVAVSCVKKRADRLTQAMITTLFADGLPIALDVENRKPISCQSLLPYLCLLAGDRLSEVYRESILCVLRSNQFFTSFGYATEIPTSPACISDGYWHGSVWAQIMLLLADAMDFCGAKDAAEQTARLFCNTASIFGFAENYNCETGEGLRAQSYTWTASVLLIFLDDFCWGKYNN